MVLPWALSRATATSGTTSGVTSGTSSSAILGATLSVTLGVTTVGALLEHCVPSPWGFITAVLDASPSAPCDLLLTLDGEELSPKPQARDWGLSVTAFLHHVA